jgi:uncharacterized protein
MSEDTAVKPVSKEARVASLDVLRGIAVLGILMMNITGFGLLPHAYGNPLVEGGAEGLNHIAYVIINVGFEGTMRGIFSLLFGASIVLLTSRMEKAGAGIMAAEVHFRRMLWMLLFGIIHWALMLWYGEILFNYAMCGLLLFSVRKLSPRFHLIAATLLLVGAALFQTVEYRVVAQKEVVAASAEAAKASGAKLTPAQTKAIEAWKEISAHSRPTDDEVAKIRGQHQGSYFEAVSGQFETSYLFQWTEAPKWLITDMIPFMLLGMAMLNLGILGGAARARTYALMLLGGYGIGLPLGLYELNLVLDGNFTPTAFAEAGRTYQFSRLAMVIGHLGLALLFIRAGLFKALQRALAATGQMALSNYLAQTIICTALFYGFGFGLYGAFERYQLYYIVAAVWAAQLIWSPIWLRHYRFGPFEWLWRSLTYWQRQPMRI